MIEITLLQRKKMIFIAFRNLSNFLHMNCSWLTKKSWLGTSWALNGWLLLCLNYTKTLNKELILMTWHDPDWRIFLNEESNKFQEDRLHILIQSTFRPESFPVDLESAHTIGCKIFIRVLWSMTNKQYELIQES